jgi:hypothetical protein
MREQWHTMVVRPSMMLRLLLAAAGPLLLTLPPAGASSTTLVASSGEDLRLAGGVEVTANPLNCLRSGVPKQHSTATFAVPLSAGAVITGMFFEYRYTTGFGVTGTGSNFSLEVAGKTVYASPHLTNYPYSSHRPNYSTAVLVTVPNLSLHVVGAGSRVSLVFDNNARNVQLLLPLRVNLTCTGAVSCAAFPELPTFIASNMVLQRAPARANIWGNNAEVGERISVQLDQGSSWNTTANSSGGWLVQLAPQQASAKNHSLAVSFSISGRRRVLTNVAFGDVFLCSGQSNMEFSLNHAFNASNEIADASRYPGLRMFTAAHAVANGPQADVGDKTGGTGVYADSPWAVSSAGAFAPAGQHDFSWFSAVPTRRNLCIYLL